MTSSIRHTTAGVLNLPEAAPRPVQWARLWQQIKIFRTGDPAQVLDAAYSTGDAIGGMSEERLVQVFVNSEKGQSLLQQRPDLAAALCNKQALSKLPADSLGQHFLAFSERYNLDSLALLEHQHAMSRDYDNLDPVRQYVADRLTVMHDVWHVVVGYDATYAGESALMCFSLPQRINDRAIPLFILLSILTGRIGLTDAWRAYSRGKRASKMALEPFEELLELPLAEVRNKLGVGDPMSLHSKRVTPQMLIPES
jgi:ubiquinone biosynthesis protein COQ4